jgi:hypothetical protein
MTYVRPGTDTETVTCSVRLESVAAFSCPVRTVAAYGVGASAEQER